MPSTKRSPGRPPKDQKSMLQPMTIRFPRAMMDEIEALRAKRLDEPDKGQMVRELVAEGIKAVKSKLKDEK